MDVWEEIYNKGKKNITKKKYLLLLLPITQCQKLKSEDGEIFTDFCIESTSGVMNLCTKRVVALNMHMNTEKKVKLVDVLPNWWGDKRYHNK